MRGATRVSLQLHQLLRLPRKLKFKIAAETPYIASADFKTIRRHSEHDPRIIRTKSELKIAISPASSETFLVRSWRRFCIENYNISRSGYLLKCRDMLCLPRKVTFRLQQILRLPQKFILHLHHLLRLPRKMPSTLLYTILLASSLSWHPFSLGVYFLRIYSLRIYSLSIYSLSIYSPSISSTHLFSTHLFSTHLFFTHLYSSRLFSSHLFSTHLFSTHLFSKHLFSKHL